MTYTATRRALSLRRMLILVVVVVAGVYSLFREPLNNILAPRCDELPALPSTVPDGVVAELTALQAAGTLACPPIPKLIEGLGERALWGTDGVDSLVVFTFAEDHPVRVQPAYADEPVQGRGGWPVPGLFPVGRPIYRNEAPDGLGVFVLHLGAPHPYGGAVNLEFRGGGIPQEGMRGRDFFTDLTNAWKKLRRQPLTTEDTKASLSFAIAPERWSDAVGEWVAPELADENGRAVITPLVTAAPAAPTPYRILAGPSLGLGLWVAGVVSGTNPTVVLNVPRRGGAERVPARSSTLWRNRDGSQLVASFSFPSRPAGEAFEALYYADRSEAEAHPDAPDARWQLVVPAPGEAAATAATPSGP